MKEKERKMQSEKAASDQSGNRLRELAFDSTKSCNKARLIFPYCFSAPSVHEGMQMLRRQKQGK